MMRLGGSGTRWFLLVLLAVLVGTAAPAGAQNGDAEPRDKGPTIVVKGRVIVPEGRTTDTVVILDGPAIIAGHVRGAVVAAHGDIRVAGTVDDDVVAFNGRAVIEDGAHVKGRVLSSDEPQVASGATVDDEVKRVEFTNYFNSLGWVLWIGWWLAVTASTLVLGLLLVSLLPRAAEATVAAARARVGPCIGWGLLLAIVLPLVSIALLFTILGIPLGLVGLASMIPLYAVGFVAGALVVGRWIIKEPRSLVVAFLVGWLILRLIDLIPALGDLVTFAATVYGLGALAVAGWRAARGRRVVPDPAGAPAPAPA